MKKILLITFLTFIFLTGCKQYSYTELSYSQLQDKLNNKDSFVLVIGSNSCSACAAYKETMKEVMKDKKVEIFYIATDTLSKEEYAKIYSKYVIVMTPTTIFIKDGKETSTYDRIVGASDYDEIIENLKKHEIIGG